MKDTKAIELVMEMYSKLLWAVVGSILNTAPTEEVEECVADVFFAFWQNPTYILPFDDNINLGTEDILNGAVNRERDEELLKAINSFSEPDREIMIRRIYYEQKPAEIWSALPGF